MREKILDKAGEMFLNLGFKSVTMDDIASEIGVSKKTIYTHFKNKTDLVKEVTNYMFDNICCGIDLIHEQEKNPIIELFEIKRFVINHLKNEKSSPQYQLQKYYPKIFSDIKKKQFDFMQNSIKENLQRGLDQQLFRDTIDVEFISRIYFYGMTAIKDNELFPTQMFSQNELLDKYLEYHLRGICTNKGIEVIEKQLKEIK
ncbi:TetR/AcrR family transcriptional regulator [Tenacibaculum sp. IB213877]|uniref:TetR/AcrR family transcriptional regulator n=1 Tax=Tenacibaculum sp. IB213877 TaxID=3097351 RepID=UPI002A5A314A|nr:TetR/AcrR family transcriptional regulator [Tenacibaculum sp. IB213877]MDY0780958.1 TetR/AcrR family transcriptional regulator [Tenacibaculum sp. IB213877]